MNVLVFTELLFLLVTLLFTNGESTDADKRFLMDTGFYEWGPWTTYGSCNPSCNGGIKERTRECYNKQTGKVVDDTFSCPGGVSGTYVTCTQDDCNTTCEDSFTKCSQYSRSDICNDGGDYSEWGKSNCARTCGFCRDNVIYEWGPWTPYGPCQPRCPGGVQTRSRDCFNQQTHKTEPNPRNCPGSNLETSLCTHCTSTKIDGQWGPWTALSQCSATCGNGVATRRRNCNNPAPSGGGRTCFGASVLKVTCQHQPCKVDGGWGSWSPWTGCSASCDLGTLSRDRKCDHPVPQNGGSQCSGNNTEIHECSSGPCPVWSHWFEGDCSVSCGNGTRERLRHCSTGRDADCVGIAYVQVPCSNVQCV